MGIFGSGGSWETAEEKLMDEYLEDMPMGAPCKADFADEFREHLACLSDDEDVELSEMSLDDVKESLRESK